MYCELHHIIYTLQLSTTGTHRILASHICVTARCGFTELWIVELYGFMRLHFDSNFIKSNGTWRTRYIILHVLKPVKHVADFYVECEPQSVAMSICRDWNDVVGPAQ